MTKVFVLVLSYNVQNDLIDCLASVKRLIVKDSRLKIVVVDNNSADKTVDTVKKEFPEVKLIINDKNLGYTGGNNVGIEYCLVQGADYVLILNPDITVDKNLVTELLAVTSQKPTIGIVGPKIYFSSGSEYHHDRYQPSDLGKVIWWAGGLLDWDNVTTIHRGVDEVDTGKYDQTEKTETVAGTAMFVKKEVFERTGLFDDKFFLYYEESDFCQRAARYGFELWYAPKAVAWHGNATATGIGSALQDYYTTRNRLLFGFRYAPLKSKLALLRQALSLLFIGRTWQRHGVMDFLLGKFGQGSYK